MVCIKGILFQKQAENLLMRLQSILYLGLTKTAKTLNTLQPVEKQF